MDGWKAIVAAVDIPLPTGGEGKRDKKAKRRDMREPAQSCIDKLWHRNPILQDRMLLRDAECNESCTAMVVDSPESPVPVAGKHTITPDVSRQILPA